MASAVLAVLARFLLTLSLASGTLSTHSQGEKACAAADLERRVLIQNKLAGLCNDMCKAVQAEPACQCPELAARDRPPGVVTWDELLEYMGDLSAWGGDSVKSWRRQASQLQALRAKAAKKGTAAMEPA